MQASVRAAWRGFNEPIEGLTSWMYLDVKGYVTTGMGNLIDPISVALPLPWNAASGTAASETDISAEWNRIKGNLALTHQGAQAARKVATLSLPDAAIDKLIQERLTKDEAILISYPAFSGFETWPADAQLGLLSMAWAMGAAFGPTFPHFSQACAAGDFNSASADCQISTAGNAGVIRRNAANRQAFLFAATATNPAILRSAIPPF